jgi:hypothetical protein
MLLFAVIGFGPLLLTAGILLAGILLNLWIMIAEAAKPFAQDVAMFALAAAGIPAVLFATIAGGWWGFRRTKSWLTGSLVLYGVWFVLAFGIAWLVARILGGASMAVVDGVADSGAVRRGTLEMAGVLLLFAQVMIVPWVLGAGRVLRRMGVRD